MRDVSTSLDMTKNKIIVALDVATKKEALDLVEQLRGDISRFKVGLQLYTAEGPEIVRAIRAAVSARPRELSLLGVTVLTSADEQTLRQIGIPDKIEDHVLRLAKLGVEARIDGLVASPYELKVLRQQFGTKIKLVVPGIRPSWSEAGDQKRVMTPREAGADYLVIGRPIIADPRPSEAVNKILSELEG